MLMLNALFSLQNVIFHDNGQVLYKNRVQGENTTVWSAVLLLPVQANRGVYAIKD